MTDEYEIVTTSVAVRPRGASVEDERATTVRLADEGGGGFVEVEQHGPDGSMTIRIEPGEWPALRDAIGEMMGIAEKEGGNG